MHEAARSRIERFAIAAGKPPDGSGRRPRRGWWIAAGLLALLLVIGLVVLWVQAPALYGRGDAAKTAAATTRGAILTVVAALVAATFAGAGLYMTARTLTETQRANREADQRDRYTKAIEQLDSGKFDVRLGGIYGLERIAEISKPDQRTVVEVLGAYVRQHTDPTRRRRQSPPTAVRDKTPPQPTVDVQAAITVLGRLPSQPGVSRGDLTRAQLAGVHLDRANLAGAILVEANLADADLRGANLADADLGDANLTWARLDGADLTDADLRGAKLTWTWIGDFPGVGANLTRAELSEADLTCARLVGANLTRAGLSGANLTSTRLDRANLAGAILGGANLADVHLSEANLGGAILGGANLAGAYLRGANLADADLLGANLAGARLARAENLTQQQLDSARGDKDTRLPDGLQRPADWSAGPAAPPAAD